MKKRPELPAIGRAVVIALLLAFGAAFAADKTVQERADRENNFKALVGDFKIYDACFAKNFAGDECARYRLRPTTNPEYWPDPKLPPVKWPEPPASRSYKPGMTAIQYFNALCEAEAGEFIFRTVKADSIYMIRPRKEEPDQKIRDRYGLEDPYGDGQGDNGDPPGPMLVGGDSPRYTERSAPSYRFVEIPLVPVSIPKYRRKYYDPNLFVDQDGALYRKLYEPLEKPKRPPGAYLYAVANTKELSSRYGFTWRGIRRPYDREFGIAGGELIVVDLQTNEILGLRRGFMLGARSKTGGISWLSGYVCPRYSQMPGLGQQRRRDKDIDYVNIFLAKVAQPPARFIPQLYYSLEEQRRLLEERKRGGEEVDIDRVMRSREQMLEKEFGGLTAYLDRLRRQGYPVDEYLQSVGKERKQ